MERFAERPPYIEFHTEAQENNAKSREAGFPVFDDVDVVHVTPVGGRDMVPHPVEEWFSTLEKRVAGGKFNGEWLNQFKAAYKIWKETREMPVDGVPLEQCAVFSKGQVETLRGLKCRSVEDVAGLNEEGIQRGGLGMRELREKARAWLGSKDQAKAAQSISALAMELEKLKTSNQLLREKLAAMEARQTDEEETL